MKEVIIFARAGQGAITTAQILGAAFLKSDKYAYAFPHFGAARMGAPMNAFLRYDDKPIRLRSQIKVADYAIIVDATLFAKKDSSQHVKPGGIVIINSEDDIQRVGDKKIFGIPANKISEEITGKHFANTVLLGSFASLTEELPIDKLVEAMKERFKGEVLDMNLKLVNAGYEYCEKMKVSV